MQNVVRNESPLDGEQGAESVALVSAPAAGFSLH